MNRTVEQQLARALRRAHGASKAVRRRWTLAYLRGRGARIDPSVRITGRVHVSGNPANLRIGRRVVLNEGVFLNARDRLSIGADSHLSPYCQVQTGYLQADGRPRRHASRPVTIGENVWVASGAVVLAGVTVGDHAIVAAGAVVTRDVEAGVVVGGVPAEVIRALDPPEPERRDGKAGGGG